MCLKFKDYQKFFEIYCKEYDLDFEMVKHLPKTCSSDFIAIQHSDGSYNGRGLLDDIPTPAVLLLKKDPDQRSITIEQTEYTDKYIALPHAAP
jgi:hypothetical protein